MDEKKLNEVKIATRRMDEKKLNEIKNATRKIVENSMILWNARIDMLNEKGNIADIFAYTNVHGCDGPMNVCGCGGPTPKCGCPADGVFDYLDSVRDIKQTIVELKGEIAALKKPAK